MAKKTIEDELNELDDTPKKKKVVEDDDPPAKKSKKVVDDDDDPPAKVKLLSIEDAEKGQKILFTYKGKDYDGVITKAGKSSVTLEFEDKESLNEAYDEDEIKTYKIRLAPKKSKKVADDDDPPAKKKSGKKRPAKEAFDGPVPKEIKVLIRELTEEESAIEKKKIRAKLRAKGYFISANK